MKYVFLPIVIFIFNQNIFYAQKEESDIISPQNTLKFADYLFCQQDFLRANKEYEKYLTFRNNDTVKFKIALGLSEMGNYTEAEKKLRILFNNSTLSDEAKLEFSKVAFLQGNYLELREFNFNQTKYLPVINRLKYFSYFYDSTASQHLPPLSEFKQVFMPVNDDAINHFYLRKIAPNYKNPVKAAIFSSLIPGTGKIYTGYYGDGITAFIVTSVLGFITYDNFRANHELRGWIFAGLTSLFYAGNIYGSAASAQIRNAEINFSFRTNLDLFIKKNNYFLPDYGSFCK